MNKTRNIKKMLSLVLVLMMVVSTMVIMPLTASAACSIVANVTPAGSGTEADPYLVGSHSEWAGLKALAEGGTLYNKQVYVKITADFNLGHACPLDNSSYPSSSNAGSIMWQIDGQGHTIGQTNVQLIMGTVGGVTIRNLTVEMASTNGEAYGAAFVGVICGNANGSVLIENCIANGTMNYKRGGTRTAGGFVGNIYSGSPTLTVRNCINNMTIYNSDSAAQPFGGILGGCENNGVVVIENCVNNGTITAKAGWVGGMLGRYTAATSVTIDNCINNGKLVNTNTYVGGMVGYQPKTANITISDCYSTGAVDMPYVAASTVEPVITNTNTVDEVRAMITMPRRDGTPLASLTAWDGATKTAPALADPEAANSAENPYLIGTAAELAYLDGNAIGYCKLTNNINMGGQPWAGMTSGNHIDGDNYTIYNIFANGYSAGFLKSGKLNAQISNLHFSALRAAGGSGAGGFAAYATGGSVLTLSNVTIDANSIIGTDRVNGNQTGGILGDDYGSSDVKVTLDRVIMGASITNVKGHASTNGTWIGGLFAAFEGATNAANMVVTNTIMEGVITSYWGGSNAEKDYVGALVGQGGAAYAWSNVYVLAGVAASGVSGKALSPAISNCYSASFVASENFADEIAEINMMNLTADNVTVAAATHIRLKLTDDFGFMPIAPLISGVSLYNPFVEYGVVVNDEFYAGDLYVDNDIQNSYCVKFTGVSVATMNQTYNYQMAIKVGDAYVLCETVQNINCFDRATIMAGMPEADLLPGEKVLYQAMLDYHNAYVAYLNSNNLKVEGAN